MTMYLNFVFRFAKFRVYMPWIDDIKDDLCRVLIDHISLVTIFRFGTEHSDIKLEDALLEAVFQGLITSK